jgi:hypothetical protein
VCCRRPVGTGRKSGGRRRHGRWWRTTRGVAAGARDGNLGVGSGHPWVSDPTGAVMGTILQPHVAPTPDPHRDGFGRGFSFTPASDPMGV